MPGESEETKMSIESSARHTSLLRNYRSHVDLADTQPVRTVEFQQATPKQEFREASIIAVQEGIDNDGAYLRGLIVAGIKDPKQTETHNQKGLVSEIRRVYAQAQISAGLINEPTEANKLLTGLETMYRQIGQEYRPQIEVSSSVSPAERERLIVQEFRRDLSEFPTRAADALMDGWHKLRAEEAVVKESLDREAKKPIGDISISQIRAQVRSLRTKEARMDRFGVRLLSELGEEHIVWYAQRQTSQEPTTQPMAAIYELAPEEFKRVVEDRIETYEAGELSDQNDIIALKMLPQADRNRVVANVVEAERRIASNRDLLLEGVRLGNPEVIADAAIKLKTLEQQRRAEDAVLKAWVASMRANISREKFVDAVKREGAWVTEGVTGFKEKAVGIWNGAKEVVEAHKKFIVDNASAVRFNSKIANDIEDFLDAASDVPLQRKLGELDDKFLGGIREALDETSAKIKGRVAETGAKVARILEERDVRKINEKREYYTKRHEARVRRDMGLIRVARKGIHPGTASEENWTKWIQTLVEDVQYPEKVRQVEESDEFAEKIKANPDFAYFAKELEKGIKFVVKDEDKEEPQTQAPLVEPDIDLSEPVLAPISSAQNMALNILRRAGLPITEVVHAQKVDPRIKRISPKPNLERQSSLTTERFKQLEKATVDELERWINRDQRYLDTPEERRPVDFEEKRIIAERDLDLNKRELERRRAK